MRLEENTFFGTNSTVLFLILDQPELKLIEQVCLKQCHVAVTSCILEGVKLNADKSTIRYTFRFDTGCCFYKYQTPPIVRDVVICGWCGNIHKVNTETFQTYLQKPTIVKSVSVKKNIGYFVIQLLPRGQPVWVWKSGSVLQFIPGKCFIFVHFLFLRDHCS